MSYSKSVFLEIAAGADLTLTGGKAACYSGERWIREAFKPLGLHREAESDSSCSCVQGTCCTGAFPEAVILLQNLPSQLACLSTIMAGSWPRVWTHDLPCRAHHRVEEAVMVACVCVLLAGSRARLSCCAEGNQAVTAPLSGQGSPRGDAGKVSTSPSADFTSSCQNSCYVLFLILSTKYTQKRLI